MERSTARAAASCRAFSSADRWLVASWSMGSRVGPPTALRPLEPALALAVRRSRKPRIMSARASRPRRARTVYSKTEGALLEEERVCAAPSELARHSFCAMTEVDYDLCLEEAIAAATAAGAEIKAAWHETRDVEYKGTVDLVTATDKKCEDLIFQRLQAAFPTHAFVGEESVAAADGKLPEITDAPTWFVDPLDGTTNFVHGFPFSCVSVGLTVNRVPVLGVVVNPILGETFAAVKGRGATLNGAPIHVSSVTDLGKALVATEIGVGRDAATVDAIIGRVKACVAGCRSLRASGSCAMNMVGVAVGRLDAFYEIGFGGPWDCVGAAVIVTEAGGIVCDPSGGEFALDARRVLCGNPRVAPALARCLAPVPDGPLEPHAPGKHA